MRFRLALAMVGSALGALGTASAMPALAPVQPVGMVRAAELVLLPQRAQMSLQLRDAARMAVAVRAQTPADALTASCVVRQILASQAPGGIDPKLAFLKQQLSNQPFSGYKSFKLLQENTLALSGGTAQSLPLVTNQTLGLAYKEKLSVAGGKIRMRMQMTLAQGEKKVLDTLYAIDEGGTLLQAGQKYQDGTFVLAITCKR